MLSCTKSSNKNLISKNLMTLLVMSQKQATPLSLASLASLANQMMSLAMSLASQVMRQVMSLALSMRVTMYILSLSMMALLKKSQRLSAKMSERWTNQSRMEQSSSSKPLKKASMLT